VGDELIQAMRQRSGPAGRMRFGPFELDPGTGELHSDGAKIILSAQPLRLLLALLERPGQLITRDELRRRLWPDDTFVDFEHGLNAAVRRVRDALGDSADRPRYIETLPRRGYRFVGEIEAGSVTGERGEAADTRPATTEAAPVAHAAVRQKWATGSTALLGSGILILIIAASWYAGFTRRVDQPGTRARELTRQTFGRGLQTDVTWSPDGQRIAFASNQDGNFDIWVQRLGGEAVRITDSPADDTQPAWSPIGDEIVFHSERDGGGLFIVAAAGGPAHQRTTFGAHPTWRADGGEILFFAAKQAWPMRHLYIVSPHGDDTPRQILSDFLRGGFWNAMAPHPDGRLTFIGTHRSQDWGVFTVGRDGKDPLTVHPSDALLQTLGWPDTHGVRFQWNRAGTALYLEVASNDIRNLWKVRVAPVTLEWLSAERLTTGSEDATVAAVAPDDERLAFTIQLEKIRGWVFAFDAGAGGPIGDGRPVTAEGAVIAHLRLSADGQSLLYDSHRAGTKTVSVMTTAVNTGKTSVLVDNAAGPVGSRNGTRVSYVRRRTGPAGSSPEANLEYVLAVRDQAGSEHFVGRWSGSVWLAASDWTRDGKSILGSYWDPKDAGPVFLVLWPAPPAVAGQPERIVLRSPNHMFWQARFSPDDRWISFVAMSTTEPGRVSLGVTAASGAARGEWTPIAADHEWPDKPRWSPDGKTLYFLSRKPAGRFNVWAVQMDPVHGRPVGEPRQITHFDGTEVTIHPDMGNSEMDVAGRSLAVTTRDVTGSIWMLSRVQH
jgi:DNA-binding winged helix-turn-helix (wHTH) protein/dipeptidyl aminopeptidase/acylaminoacyl peptidase